LGDFVGLGAGVGLGATVGLGSLGAVVGVGGMRVLRGDGNGVASTVGVGLFDTVCSDVLVTWGVADSDVRGVGVGAAALVGVVVAALRVTTVKSPAVGVACSAKDKMSCWTSTLVFEPGSGERSAGATDDRAGSAALKEAC